MKKHRRKLALFAALALLFGSAAASAANYTAGRGAMPSLAGASDALGWATSGATSAANWIITRARATASNAFSYPVSAPSRPAEVANPPSELPMYTRGLPSPIDVDPHWAPSAPSALGVPDRVPAISFDEGVAPTNQPTSIPAVSLLQSSLPGPSSSGSNTPVTLLTPSTPRIPDTPGTPGTTTVIPSVPELPPYAMLIAGMSLLAAFARRRKTS